MDNSDSLVLAGDGFLCANPPLIYIYNTLCSGQEISLESPVAGRIFQIIGITQAVRV